MGRAGGVFGEMGRGRRGDGVRGRGKEADGKREEMKRRGEGRNRNSEKGWVRGGGGKEVEKGEKKDKEK